MIIVAGYNYCSTTRSNSVSQPVTRRLSLRVALMHTNISIDLWCSSAHSNLVIRICLINVNVVIWWENNMNALNLFRLSTCQTRYLWSWIQWETKVIMLVNSYETGGNSACDKVPTLKTYRLVWFDEDLCDFTPEMLNLFHVKRIGLLYAPCVFSFLLLKQKLGISWGLQTSETREQHGRYKQCY
jgi:hypothetical protein